ncbi:ribonuclease H-like domain-containing protein [Tanacetum coccineum]|uniref:Ribonuclease H-like domain-containing protein n=1 Tax=Tanacetum coccineum TaxID=301880 RepID=A0ABQ5HGX8_9ASTR
MKKVPPISSSNLNVEKGELAKCVREVRGEDVPFIQAVKPNIDVLVNEESIAPLDKIVQKNIDHLVVFEVDAASLDKLVQFENKLVHSLTSTTPTTRDETSNVIAKEIEVVNAMKYVEPPDVAYLQDDNVDEPHFENTVQVNVEMEGYMDVDNEEDKSCLDNMSISFEEDKCNREIKVTLYEEEHTEMCDTMDTANTKMDLDRFITDVTHTEKMAVKIEANRSESMNLDSVDKNDPKDVRLQDEDIMYDIDLYFHLEILVDLLWHFRALDADWAITCPHFCPSIVGGGMPTYYANNQRYHVPWTDVEKVYFPLNEPQLHWALTELHIRTDMNGVLKIKGLDVGEIRLTHKVPLVFGDPLQVALAYREQMLAYFWKYKLLHIYVDDHATKRDDSTHNDLFKSIPVSEHLSINLEIHELPTLIMMGSDVLLDVVDGVTQEGWMSSELFDLNIILVEHFVQEYEPTSAEEKQDRRNEMKARGNLLMALPNKDQLKFHSYKDAKFLMEAIAKRYGGNKESKKVQRTLLKQQYENFTRSSSETMDQTFDRSLPSEWKTHALIWRNKEEIETISLDDLYNNLKIYEPELTRSSSTSQNPQNVAFVSSNSTNSNCNSSTNEADNTAYGVSAAHTQCNPTSGDNLSDAMICAFLASQPNSPQLAREDLEQIDPDDLEEMDLQWEMAMLTIRARRFIKRTGRKLDVNGQRVGFDRSKVECYNCHKNGHFARECRAPRNQENRGRENSRRTMTVETPTKNALVAQDGIGGSSSSSDSEVDSCSKSCVKAYATLKEQYDSLSLDYKKSQFNLVSYKAGLESVEARLAHYKKNEVVFEESINVLNLEVKLRDNALVENKKKLEKAEKERDDQVIDKFKTGLGYNAASSTTASPAAESFVNSSEMLDNQECNKSKSDRGYHVVSPPYIGNFIPFKPNLTFMDKIIESENIDVITIVTPSNVKKVESNHESANVKNNGDAVEPKTVRKNSFRPRVIED